MFCNTLQALPECKGIDYSKWTNCFGDTANASYVGIGITLERKITKDGLKLLSIVDNSPAFDAGLKADDHIVRINGVEVSTLDYEDAINMNSLRGGSPGGLGQN